MEAAGAEKPIYRASTTAPVNIAVIKYWGKRDPKLNLPTNSSLSVSLDQADLRTHTTASCSSSYSSPDTLTLNSKPESLEGARPQACLSSLRALRSELEEKDPSLPKLSTLPLRIVSSNNFPTAAGLASSAAGFAALIRAIADLYELPQDPTTLSLIARQGSGSACRSLLGGYVAWDHGTEADGSDSKARLVAPKSHWPSMRALILVASHEKKDVSSTAGMQTTVQTSQLFKTRAEVVVPAAMEAMEKAIAEKDFESFAKVTMRDSDSFHATCLDTTPPIFYMNDTSRAAIRAVENLNKRAGKIIAAYTFDAGPNAVIYYLHENREAVVGPFKRALGEKEGWLGQQGAAIGYAEIAQEDEIVMAKLKSGVSRVILTGVGEGPVSVQEHLVDEQGNPAD
ncbi:MAG: diphosphomevalonate decarboxylase [Heterodermia speciosa]|uniref:Diphosphomevalonate decarboxylase n=1 Tax=Heterodermia speciosa TaxID=116794 RepID=A0A8H3IA95_9LECA|nr:MAG: diphosphomevalonate decarboxylase [Heterodermia speciosa]